MSDTTPKTWNIGDKTFRPRPRTLAVERDLAAIRAEFSAINADRAELSARTAAAYRVLEAAQEASDPDTREKHLADARDQLIAIDALAEKLGDRDNQAALQLASVYLIDGDGNAAQLEHLEAEADLDDVRDVVEWSNPLTRPTPGETS